MRLTRPCRTARGILPIREGRPSPALATGRAGAPARAGSTATPGVRAAGGRRGRRPPATRPRRVAGQAPAGGTTCSRSTGHPHARGAHCMSCAHSSTGVEPSRTCRERGRVLRPFHVPATLRAPRVTDVARRTRSRPPRERTVYTRPASIAGHTRSACSARSTPSARLPRSAPLASSTRSEREVSEIVADPSTVSPS